MGTGCWSAQVVLVVTLALLGSATASAQIYKCTGEYGKPLFTDRPCGSEQGIQAAASVSDPPEQTKLADITSTTQHSQVLEPIDNQNSELQTGVTISTRALLTGGKFSAINKQLQRFESEAKTNGANEANLFDAYLALGLPTAEQKTRLQRWRNSTPDTYQPYLALAMHAYNHGWLARGGAWSSETEEQQFTAMRAHFEQAQSYLEQAAQYNPPTAIPTYLQIGIWKTQKDSSSLQSLGKTLDHALTEYPGSYVIRAHFMHALYPRWGGSYAAMSQFASLSQDKISLNPKIRWLQGLVDADRAFMATRMDAYKRADSLYASALQYGPNPEVLRQRARNSYEQENYTEALAYINQSILGDPEKADALRLRCITQMKLDDLDAAVRDCRQAQLLNPLDDVAAENLRRIANRFYRQGTEFGKSREYQSALQQYARAIELKPGELKFRYGRAWTLNKVGEYAAALDELKRCIDIEPSDFNSHLLLDRILTRSRDWGEIVQYWNAYISLQPSDQEAYFERAGTYHHLGDREASLQDLKKASELGHPEATRQYQALLAGSDS